MFNDGLFKIAAVVVRWYSHMHEWPGSDLPRPVWEALILSFNFQNASYILVNFYVLFLLDITMNLIT
jgi:hypothetical protein